MKKASTLPRNSVQALSAKLVSLGKQLKTIKSEHLQRKDARAAEAYLKTQLN